jgi:hypothetical protein
VIDQQIIHDLVRSVNKVVGIVTTDPNAAIVVRDYDGVFLYVNSVWTGRYEVDPVGKTIPELGILSVEEGKRSVVEDNVVKEKGSLITVDTYHISGEPVKMAVVRVLLTYHSEQFQIGVLYNLGSSTMSDAEEFQYASADLLVWRLQGLSDT